MGDNIEWSGNPLKDKIHTYYIGKNDSYKRQDFVPSDLAHLDDETGANIYVNKRGYRVVLKRQNKKVQDTFGALEFSIKKKKEIGVLADGVKKMLLEDSSTTDESDSDSDSDSRDES